MFRMSTRRILHKSRICSHAVREYVQDLSLFLSSPNFENKTEINTKATEFQVRCKKQRKMGLRQEKRAKAQARAVSCKFASDVVACRREYG